MFSIGKPPLRRHVRNSALVLAFGLSFWALQPAIAQTSSGSDFASSASSFGPNSGPGPAASLDPSPSPASPSPAAGAAEQGNSYGYRDKSITGRLTFEGGAGVNAPIGNDQDVITWGGNFTGGVGYRFTKRASLMAEYQFIDDKLPGALIADAGAQGGHAHIWSLTLDPVIDLFPKAKNSVYVTGGGGFYRKVTSFTDPEEVEECYYFCVVGTENVVVSHFSSNQGGLNLGLGFTHTLGSPDTGGGNLKAFVEARYLWLNTPKIGSGLLGTTELIPVTVGLRF